MHDSIPNMPSITLEELWNRNEYFRNWGNLKPFRFRKGVPQFIVSSYIPLFYLIFYLGISTVFLAYGLYCKSLSWLYLLLLASIIFNAMSIIFFYESDPGVCSNSLPLLNQDEVSRNKNFCIDCQRYETLTQKHCIECGVCISQAYYHSPFLKICISASNLKAFKQLWISVIILTLANLIIKLV